MPSSFSNTDLEYMFWAGIRNGSIGTIGTKGDPGGIVDGAILTTQDLNTITTSGVSRCVSGANATLVNNYPVAGQSGVLVTLVRDTGGPSVIQTYYPYFAANSQAAKYYYVRWSSNGVTWFSWKMFSSQRVDQTAGRAIYQWDDLNNREQLIYGDTGTRRFETELINGWTGGLATIRRVGHTVSLGLYNLNPAAQTSTTLYTLPAGFGPSGYGGNINYPIKNLDSTTSWLIVDASRNIQQAQVSQISASGAVGVLTWQTAESWPTVLPGTASGVIPNL